MKITVGLPAFNEEANIASIIVKLKKITETIIVCNDGSTDLTSEIAKKMGAIVIDHPKNLGYGGAINSIFKKAKEINSDLLVTFDADGQHKIDDIFKVIEPIKKGEADLVIGSRFLDITKEEVPEIRKIGIKIITKVTNSSLKEKITDAQSGFRAYNKDIISKLNISDMGMGISTEILIKIQKAGFRISEIPIIISYEGDTSTHNPVSHGTSVVFSTLKYVAIERPLTFYGIPGVIFLIIGLSFGIWTTQIFSVQGKIITNIALIGISGVIFGTILIITATILHSIVSVVRENRRKN